MTTTQNTPGYRVDSYGNGLAYLVDSYGNGLAYLVTRMADGAEFHVQGDDADQFRADVYEQDMDYDWAIDMLYSDAFI